MMVFGVEGFEGWIVEVRERSVGVVAKRREGM
jgi:hypothetical protein